MCPTNKVATRFDSICRNIYVFSYVENTVPQQHGVVQFIHYVMQLADSWANLFMWIWWHIQRAILVLIALVFSVFGVRKLLFEVYAEILRKPHRESVVDICHRCYVNFRQAVPEVFPVASNWKRRRNHYGKDEGEQVRPSGQRVWQRSGGVLCARHSDIRIRRSVRRARRR